MNEEAVNALRGKITSIRVEYSRSAEVTDGDWRKSGLAIEATVTPDDNVRDVVLAAQSYTEAFVNKVLGPAAEAIRAQTVPEQAETPVSYLEALKDGASEAEVRILDKAIGIVAPANAQTPAKEGEEGHTRIARFTLTPKPKGLLLLELYPLLGSGEKKAKYPELKFTANRDGMWKMLGEEWNEGWEVPCDEEVDWLVDWRLGNEYVKTQGPHAGEKGRYRDVVAIHGA